MPLLLLALGGCMQTPQAKSARFIANGRKLLEKGDPSRAILEFRNAVQATPRDPNAWYELGAAYYKGHDIRPAVAALRKALELDPKHAGARLKIAQMKAETSDSDLLKGAKGDLQELLKEALPTSEMLDTLAMTEIKLGEIGSAVDILEHAASQSSPDLQTFVMLAQAKFWQKDLAGAELALKDACTALPRSADAHTVLAEFYMSQKRLQEAEPELRKALAADSGSGAALFDLARLQLIQGRRQEADQSLRQLAGLDGYKPIYGVFLFQVGRRDEAVREFERVVRENPRDRAVRSYLLSAYQSLGRAADVDRVLTAALQKNPKDTDALLKRAEVLGQRGEYNKAEADLNDLIRMNATMPEAHYIRAAIYKLRGSRLIYRQELSETLRLNPALLAVRIELVRDYVDSNEGQAALDTLEGAPPSQKQTPQVLVTRNWALWAKGDLQEMRKGIDAGLARQRTTELLLQDALWKFRSGNPAAAQPVLREVLNADPSNLLALQALNGTYMSQKNASAALDQVKQYAARAPNSAPVQNLLVQLLLAKGDLPQAKAVLTAAKAASPHAVELDLSLAQVDYAEHKYDEADRRLQTILAADPKEPTARLWLGFLEMKRGNHTAAIDHLRKAVDTNPDDAMAGNDLAYELAEHTSSLDEALKYAQHAVELAPNQPAFADTLGWILYRKGLYPSAISYLERANTDTQDAVARYHLAMAYAKAGDRKRGAATLDSALKLDPSLPEAKIARDLVGAASARMP
jgi:tetratricopeptide (TPR) repeat protein